jgi:uncharacterized protein YfaT (DUF1175 family)
MVFTLAVLVCATRATTPKVLSDGDSHESQYSDEAGKRASQVDVGFGDHYSNGTPDFLRLQDVADRAAFRNWFTLIAEYQYVNQSEAKLPSEINDCAALLRYAYREALHVHDAAWTHERGYEGIAAPASVRAYHFPDTPLKAAIFRTRKGAFTTADLNDGTFAEFADARSLKDFNTHLVGRELRFARPGDLLFYRQLEQHSPFHSMVFIGVSQLAVHDSADHDEPLVVYHTGPIGKSSGEIRRVPISALLTHPDARWRPVRQNPNFLGVYRWNILKED